MPKRTRSQSRSRVTKRRKTRAPMRKRRSSGVSASLIGNRRPNYSFGRWISGIPTVGRTLGTGTNIATYDSATSIWSTGVSASSSGLGLAFSLDDLPNKTEFTSLFDQMCLTKVLVTLKMVSNPDAVNAPFLGTGGQVTNFFPTLWYKVDKDDNSAPSLATIREMSGARRRVLRPNQEVRISLSPRPMMYLVKDNTGTSSYQPAPQRINWIDCVDLTPLHHGLKLCLDLEGLTSAITPINNFQIKINCRYFFTAKGVL